MEMLTSYSTASDVKVASNEISSSMVDGAGLILFFSSPRYDLEVLGRTLEKRFPRTPIAGCSSSGEMVSGKVLEGSVVAMCFPSSVVEKAYIEKVRDLTKIDGVKTALSNISKQIWVRYQGPGPKGVRLV